MPTNSHNIAVALAVTAGASVTITPDVFGVVTFIVKSAS